MDLLNPYYNTQQEYQGESDGKYAALRLRFTLEKSSYATMCVRELTKLSTAIETLLQSNEMADLEQEDAAEADELIPQNEEESEDI